MRMNIAAREKFVSLAKDMFGSDKKTISRAEIKALVTKKKLDYPNWITNDLGLRAGRGLYFLKVIQSGPPVSVPSKEKKVNVSHLMAPSIPNIDDPMLPVFVSTNVDMAPTYNVPTVVNEINLTPERASGYVPFGYFSDVKSIAASGMFYPVYVTGLSGNGKTMMIEQVHAELKKELIRVNITIETDEDDLIGGFRLQNGATVWQDGPAVIAMLRGCSLLLDEVDLGSNKLMCLQPILEGKGIFLKKINKMVYPAPGFNIFATANTKGKGSDDGRFIGTNVMNEAFLERFSITLEQDYPNSKVETKILSNVLGDVVSEDSSFIKLLVMWAEIVRETYKQGGISEIISTRRLVHICQAYGIFSKDRKKSILLCLNRFDDDTKQSMIQLYENLDESLNPTIPKENIVTPGDGQDDVDTPF